MSACIMLRHVWNEQYAALYDRTYRVLYDAGINEKLANELATHHTVAAALNYADSTAKFRPLKDRLHQPSE